MKNTKTVAAILLGAFAIMGWFVANSQLWELGGEPFMRSIGFVATSLGLPAIAIALWLDIKARRK